MALPDVLIALAACRLLQQIKPARGANQNIRGGEPPKVLTRKAAAGTSARSECDCREYPDLI